MLAGLATSLPDAFVADPADSTDAETTAQGGALARKLATLPRPRLGSFSVILSPLPFCRLEITVRRPVDPRQI
jgi:hypothetical protein